MSYCKMEVGKKWLKQLVRESKEALMLFEVISRLEDLAISLLLNNFGLSTNGNLRQRHRRFLRFILSNLGFVEVPWDPNVDEESVQSIVASSNLECPYTLKSSCASESSRDREALKKIKVTSPRIDSPDRCKWINYEQEGIATRLSELSDQQLIEKIIEHENMNLEISNSAQGAPLELCEEEGFERFKVVEYSSRQVALEPAIYCQVCKQLGVEFDSCPTCTPVRKMWRSKQIEVQNGLGPAFPRQILSTSAIDEIAPNQLGLHKEDIQSTFNVIDHELFNIELYLDETDVSEYEEDDIEDILEEEDIFCEDYIQLESMDDDPFTEKWSWTSDSTTQKSMNHGTNARKVEVTVLENHLISKSVEPLADRSVGVNRVQATSVPELRDEKMNLHHDSLGQSNAANPSEEKLTVVPKPFSNGALEEVKFCELRDEEFEELIDRIVDFVLDDRIRNLESRDKEDTEVELEDDVSVSNLATVDDQEESRLKEDFLGSLELVSVGNNGDFVGNSDEIQVLRGIRSNQRVVSVENRLISDSEKRTGVRSRDSEVSGDHNHYIEDVFDTAGNSRLVSGVCAKNEPSLRPNLGIVSLYNLVHFSQNLIMNEMQHRCYKWHRKKKRLCNSPGWKPVVASSIATVTVKWSLQKSVPIFFVFLFSFVCYSFAPINLSPLTSIAIVCCATITLLLSFIIDFLGFIVLSGYSKLRY